ncbi:glucosamine inositolphosphorylceramide transferase family protein [Kinneretia aquatilis]|uniref:glucosamine inositolphosphorylceramide transferase family protein n=1 Tax=Kinneretia aquatilis TaxID=2070761 RepID=UPI0014952BE0|nr:glycosyl hydrolase family 43 [Paucibacter aquatile]WIV98369.1 hypothetical protein K9V56_002335 [Paucibacter aquatile]
MFKRPRTDFWQVGIVPAPIEALDATRLQALAGAITWLPSAGPWRYLADPFGLRRGDTLHVFVEAFDYRTKHAVIERHELGAADLQWRSRRTVLARPFHLSYPQVFEHEGATFMVPESAQAGEVALYCGDDSLNHWQRECALLSDLPVADASLIEHQGRWWMFFSLVGPGARDQRELHLAHAPALTGPWKLHAGNPIRVDRSGARPAGRPFHAADGAVMLPVQDSSRSYGGATRMLRFEHLGLDRVHCAPTGLHLHGALARADHADGLHTLSACQDLTLIDVKRFDHSRAKQWLDLKRRARRLIGRPAPLPPFV